VSVGIRELKNRLCHYLDLVKAGEKLAVTDRGRVIAYILPSEKSQDFEELARLVREEQAVWKGGKPKGSKEPVTVKGKPVSEIILEERR
jgi:prevent-host-death family protein